MTITVELDKYEMWNAGHVGFRRAMESWVEDRGPRFEEKVHGETFGYHIIAALSEAAFGKAFKQYWSMHENHFECGDFECGVEVRWSMMNSVKVRPRDTGIIVSVTGVPPCFTLVGWIDAEKAKQKQWEKDFGRGKPAYFVPHSQLNAMEDLQL